VKTPLSLYFNVFWIYFNELFALHTIICIDNSVLHTGLTSVMLWMQIPATIREEGDGCLWFWDTCWNITYWCNVSFCPCHVLENHTKTKHSEPRVSNSSEMHQFVFSRPYWTASMPLLRRSSHSHFLLFALAWCSCAIWQKTHFLSSLQSFHLCLNSLLPCCLP